MRGALRRVPREQVGRGMQQEPQQRPVGFSEIERALQGIPGGGRGAERVPGDRLQQERLSQPGRPEQWRGAIQDRRDRGERRVRVTLREPQRRQADAHCRTVAVLVGESGEVLLGGVGIAEPDPCSLTNPRG